MTKQGALGIGEASNVSDIMLFDVFQVMEAVKVKTRVDITTDEARRVMMLAQNRGIFKGRVVLGRDTPPFSYL